MSDTPKLSAVQNLRDYRQQQDADGVIVGVSRQALDEALDHITALEAENERLKRDCGIWERTAKVRTEGLVGAEAELARIKGRLTDGKIAMLVADRIGYPCDQATPPCLGMCHCSNTARDIIEHITEEPKP